MIKLSVDETITIYRVHVMQSALNYIIYLTLIAAFLPYPTKINDEKHEYTE